MNSERTLKNEEKLEEIREKVNSSNCTESVTRQVYITPVVGMQNDEENSNLPESNHVMALSENTDTRMKSLEGQVQDLHSKLDSRLNSQEDFEGNLPKLLFFFSVIVRHMIFFQFKIFILAIFRYPFRNLYSRTKSSKNMGLIFMF